MRDKLLILLLLSLFVLSSCSGSGGRFFGRSASAESPYQGTGGLEMEFLENLPLDSVPEDTEFKIDVELRNEGSSEIIDGMLFLGLEENFMTSKFGYDDVINLEGKTRTNPVSDREVKTFLIETGRLGDQTESISTDIYVTTCYSYRTEASFNVCIDPKYNELVTEKACDVKAVSSSGQGAPVVVTRVEPKMLGFERIKPQFTITIKNRGNGEVIKNDQFTLNDACSSGQLTPDDINVVDVQAFLSEVPLKCVPPNPLKLKGKEDVVRCTLEKGFVEDEPAFSTLLTVILDYGYTSTISKEIEIEKVIY